MHPKSRIPRLLALLLLLLPSAASAAEGRADTLRLKDGTILVGAIAGQVGGTVVLRHDLLGEVKVPVAALAMPPEAGWDDAAAADAPDRRPGPGARPASIDPADHALFFLPTAFTPPQGSFLFRDFELLFLTLGYAPTPSTTVTGGFLFPVTSEFQLFTAGLKQQLWRHPEDLAAVALAGNVTKPVGDGIDGEFFATSNLVVGYRSPNAGLKAPDGFGLHGALGYLGASDGDGDWNDAFSYGFGAEARLTRNAKAMIEYLSAAPFDPDAEAVDGGILSFGIRLHGARLSADIAGFRPLFEDDIDLVLLPLLVVSYRI